MSDDILEPSENQDVNPEAGLMLLFLIIGLGATGVLAYNGMWDHVVATVIVTGFFTSTYASMSLYLNNE